MTKIGSYSSVYAIGHRAIPTLFDGPVIVEEKIDGSQFSMRVVGGELRCRSKRKELHIDAPESLFKTAVEMARDIAPELHEGWIYRCEYLAKPKHNGCEYLRVPERNLMLFDVETAPQMFLPPIDKAREAGRIHLEPVPMFFEGVIEDHEMFKRLLQRTSVLGGCLIEGVVVKNYSQFAIDKKVAMGKYVSEAFKETQRKAWREGHPTQKDIVSRLIDEYRTPVRWEKAVQHLRDDGAIEGSPRDIGMLVKEVPADIAKECEGDIKDALFRHFWPQIRRGVTAGLAEWYKDQLVKSAFEGLGQ